MLGAVHRPRVQGDEQPGRDRRHHRHRPQGEDGQREHPLVVGLAAVPVLPGRLDQQGHHDAGQDAADHDVVDGVRDRVRVVVGVGQGGVAERDREHERAQEAGHPRNQRADGHRAGRPGQAGALGRPLRRALTPVRAGRVRTSGRRRGRPRRGPRPRRCQPGYKRPGAGRWGSAGSAHPAGRRSRGPRATGAGRQAGRDGRTVRGVRGRRLRVRQDRARREQARLARLRLWLRWLWWLVPGGRGRAERVIPPGPLAAAAGWRPAAASVISGRDALGRDDCGRCGRPAAGC